MSKKFLSLALALVMCLGLTVPAFAVASDWKLEVPGKTDAEVFVGGKTFILRDWNFDVYDPSFGEIVSYNLYKDNVCVLAKGDTAVFTYKPEESTNQGGFDGFGGAAGGGSVFSLEAWSDPDGDGVYDRRMISESYDHEEGELAPGNEYEVLPVGTDVDFMEIFGYYQPMWGTGGEDLVRLSADRVLELFGPNTLVKINVGILTVDPAEGDWYILVEGNTTQPTQPAGTTASPTNDKLEVNGAAADPTVYKIGDSNYFKIRDVAALLSGTEKQFAVGYDGEKNAVTATTGQGYDKQSGDLAGAATGGSQTADPSNDAIYVNGEKITAEVYKINGSNYFKLRDLGKALNFYVGWSAERGMYIETGKPYSE